MKPKLLLSLNMRGRHEVRGEKFIYCLYSRGIFKGIPYIHPNLLKLSMAFSITELVSTSFSGVFTSFTDFKTQPEFSVGGKGHRVIKLSMFIS